MNIELESILFIGSPLATIAISWGIIRTRVEGLKEENQKQWEVITDLRDWKDEHEKDSSDYRLQIEKTFGSIREASASREGKLDDIIRRLETIEKMLEKR